MRADAYLNHIFDIGPGEAVVTVRKADHYTATLWEPGTELDPRSR
jgi:hypothetical protein